MDEKGVPIVTYDDRIQLRRDLVFSLRQVLPTQPSADLQEKAILIEDRDVYGPSKNDRDIYNVYASRVLLYYSFWKSISVSYRIWWDTHYKTFIGTHLQCEESYGYFRTLQLYVRMTNNKIGIMFIDEFIGTEKYTILNVWCNLYHRKEAPHRTIEHLNTGTPYNVRFLVEYYSKPETFDTRLRFNMLSRLARTDYNGSCMDEFSRRLYGWELFTGVFTVQSYERAQQFGITVCGNRGDTLDQLPIVLKTIFGSDKMYSPFKMRRDVLMLRLVCKKWNKTIMECGKFWMQYNHDPRQFDVPLEQLGGYIVARAVAKNGKKMCEKLSDSIVNMKRTIEDDQERLREWKRVHTHLEQHVEECKKKIKIFE